MGSCASSVTEENEFIIEWIANWNNINKSKTLSVKQFMQTLSPKIINELLKKTTYDNETIQLLILGYMKSNVSANTANLYKDIIKIIAIYVEISMDDITENNEVVQRKMKLRVDEEHVDEEIGQTDAFQYKQIQAMVEEVQDITTNLKQEMDIERNDALNKLMKSRKLNILCEYEKHGTLAEKLVIRFNSAKKAIKSVLDRKVTKTGKYDTNKYVHLSDWWAEQLEDMAAEMW
eukprot:228757_1